MVAGIDPGSHGAIAYLYDDDTLVVDDIPTWNMLIGKTKKRRIDHIPFWHQFQGLAMMNCKLIMIEQVGGRPAQSASAAYQFGLGVGLILGYCTALKLPVEMVPPGTWKKIMRVPGKREGAEKSKDKEVAIVARAQEVFPHYAHLFRNERGTLLHDRAEAALLAKYCRDYALHNASLEKISDLEMKAVAAQRIVE